VRKRKQRESRSGMKQCNSCQEWRTLDDFQKHHRTPDGRRQPCRLCRRANGGRKRGYAGPREIIVNGEKRYRCSKCTAFLPREAFSWRKSGAQPSYCRPCAVQDAKEWAKRNPDRVAMRKRARHAVILRTGSYQNPQACRQELLIAIESRYRHYVRSEKKRLKKRLDRQINAHDMELQRQYEQAKSVKAVSIDQFLDFILAREPICECCGKALDMTIGSIDFAVDHFHDTGLLRGLLCNPCNLGLGSFNDDIGTVLRAKEYLEGHHAKRGLPEMQKTPSCI